MEKYLKINKNNFFLSLFLSVTIWLLWLSKQNLELSSIKNGIYSVASFNLVDINARIRIFYFSIFYFIISFLSTLTISNWISQTRLNAYYIKLINHLSIIGLIALSTKLYNTNSNFTVNLILTIIFSLGGLIILITIFQNRSNIFLNRSEIIWLSILGLSITSLCNKFFFLFNISADGSQYFLLGSLLLLFYSLYFFYKKNSSQNAKLAYILQPLIFLPFIPFLSTEIYLIFNQRAVELFSPNKLYLLLLIWVGIIIYLKYLKSRKKNIPSLKTQNLRFYIPLSILSIGFITFYKPIIEQPTDMFELANQANGMMRLFKFHEVPIIQSFSSHMLSEQLFPIFYILLNGYNATLDFIVYNFFHEIIYLFVCYYFLSKLFPKSYLPLLLIVFFPYLKILISIRYVLALLSIILLCRTILAFTFKNLMIIGCWTIFLLFWSMDLGIANAISVVGILVVDTVTKFKWKKIKNGLSVAIIISIFTIGVMAIISSIFNIDLINNLNQIKEYAGAAQAHGTVRIAPAMDRYYFYHYYLFPMLSILLLISVSIQYNEWVEIKPFATIAIIFLLLFNIINAQRGLVRHNFIEGQDQFISSTFYLGFLIYVISFFKNINYKQNAFILSSLLIIPNFKYPNAEEYVSLYEQLQTELTKSKALEPSNKIIARTITNANFSKNNYESFCAFMSEHYPNQASFIDFSNSPMLYFYSQCNVPSFFNQYMQNTVTESLQNENIAYLKKTNLPVLVFSHIPERWGDHTDGVPNSLRYYPITKYLYSNYHPMVVINNYSIWIKNEEEITNKNILPSDSALIFQAQTYDLKKLPLLLAKDQESFNKTEITKCQFQNDTLYFNLASSPNKNDMYISMQIENNNEKELDANLNIYDTNLLGSFTLKLLPGNGEYIIPASILYNWHKFNPNKLYLSFNKKHTIKTASIILLSPKI